MEVAGMKDVGEGGQGRNPAGGFDGPHYHF